VGDRPEFCSEDGAGARGARGNIINPGVGREPSWEHLLGGAQGEAVSGGAGWSFSLLMIKGKTARKKTHFVVPTGRGGEKTRAQRVVCCATKTKGGLFKKKKKKGAPHYFPDLYPPGLNSCFKTCVLGNSAFFKGKIFQSNAPAFGKK